MGYKQDGLFALGLLQGALSVAHFGGQKEISLTKIFLLSWSFWRLKRWWSFHNSDTKTALRASFFIKTVYSSAFFISIPKKESRMR